MTLLRSLIMAFSCFSQFPTPQLEWKPESMRYMMCFFPIVGVAIGLILALWVWICDAVGFGAVLRGAGLVLIPMAISGGIHMDGFADTCDALASNTDPQRRREILKDSHTGAFAVIGVGMYLVAYVAFASEVDASAQIVPIMLTPVFSRCLSGVATVAFAPGVGKGMLFEFHNSANRRNSFFVLSAMSIACIILLVVVNPFVGICMTCVALACLAGLYFLSEKTFCGMSGDLAGFFLQMCELALLACIAIAGKAVF